ARWSPLKHRFHRDHDKAASQCLDRSTRSSIRSTTQCCKSGSLSDTVRRMTIKMLLPPEPLRSPQVVTIRETRN
uniref:Uncharacterized protein n=1 Tax=Globisporangium ultimum (strain ATCC 200006 / CBS 805.95 / DAOM BR144) TaxID=431595 RepID=K3X926_GLOUD